VRRFAALLDKYTREVPEAESSLVRRSTARRLTVAGALLLLVFSLVLALAGVLALL
jgi:hypothetical protein